MGKIGAPKAGLPRDEHPKKLKAQVERWIEVGSTNRWIAEETGLTIGQVAGIRHRKNTREFTKLRERAQAAF